MWEVQAPDKQADNRLLIMSASHSRSFFWASSPPRLPWFRDGRHRIDNFATGFSVVSNTGGSFSIRHESELIHRIHSFFVLASVHHSSRVKVSAQSSTFDNKPVQLSDRQHWFVSCISAKPFAFTEKEVVCRKQRKCVMVFQREKAKSCPGSSKECRTRKSHLHLRSVHAPFRSICSVFICILTSTQEPKQLCGFGGVSETLNEGGQVDRAWEADYAFVCTSSGALSITSQTARRIAQLGTAWNEYSAVTGASLQDSGWHQTD